jgi:hypothetical protein
MSFKSITYVCRDGLGGTGLKLLGKGMGNLHRSGGLVG